MPNNPNTLKKLSILINGLQYYSYWDYMVPWVKLIWIQNRQEKHSWFIKFSREIEIPNWFKLWWQKYGALKTIFPKYLPTTLHHMEEGNEEAIFSNFVVFQIPWVWKWKFNHGTINNILVLLRCVQVRWWETFDTNYLNRNTLKYGKKGSLPT